MVPLCFHVGSGMSDAPAQQKTHGRPPTHGHNSRVRVLKNRGLDAINGRTRAGKEAKRWKAWVTAQKGNGNSSPHLKNEIELSTLDLWLILELGAWIVEDSRKRGAVLNLRRNKQYEAISARFTKRCESLKLEDNGQLDLARRLSRAQGATNRGEVDGRDRHGGGKAEPAR